MKEEFGCEVEDGYGNTKKTFYGMKPIAKSEMNFVCLTWGPYLFVDSVKLIEGSLEQLINITANRKQEPNPDTVRSEVIEISFSENHEITKEKMSKIMMMTTKKAKIPYADNSEETTKDKGLPHDLERWVDTITG